MNMGLIMLPMIISGVSIGQILNTLMPELILVILFVTILGACSVTMMNKAYNLYKKEV
jgi:uncharacterized membrane protein YfcA